jgi:hypothetical protein
MDLVAMPTSFELPLDADGRLKKIKMPAVSKYGIYIIRLDKEIVRVGESSSGAVRIVKGLREPLRRIRKGKDRKNYLAYHWRAEYRNSSIYADYFPLDDNPFSDNHLRRALEAEVTLQLRLALRAWPKCMSEIHFLERCSKDNFLVKVGVSLLAHYGHKYNHDV